MAIGVRRTKRTYVVRTLGNDVARCVGSNCRQKRNCIRHLQIELDKQGDNRYARFVYVDALLDRADECSIQIGVQQ